MVIQLAKIPEGTVAKTLSCSGDENQESGKLSSELPHSTTDTTDQSIMALSQALSPWQQGSQFVSSDEQSSLTITDHH